MIYTCKAKHTDDCVTNVVETLIIFFKLGFIIHPIKSQFIPSKELITLGFILNSATMTIGLTKEKKQSLRAVSNWTGGQNHWPVFWGYYMGPGITKA